MNENPESPEAFGFEADNAPKDEKYNTRYIVSNMQGDDRKKKILISIVVTIALVGFAAMMVLSRSSTVAPVNEAEPAETKEVPSKAAGEDSAKKAEDLQ